MVTHPPPATARYAIWMERPSAVSVMMVLFFHAARLALVTFDPYLGSYDLAKALEAAPPGRLVADNQYYTFSSVFFYANERTKGTYLLNGRVNNLEYGSNAPGAPQVFIDDAQFKRLWASPERYYLLVEKPAVTKIAGLAGNVNLHMAAESGGKFLYSNLPLSTARTPGMNSLPQSAQ
jgi:hypothetical protein